MKIYKEYARSQGVETSIFDYFNNDGGRYVDQKLGNFIRALEQQVQTTGIGDLDLFIRFYNQTI